MFDVGARSDAHDVVSGNASKERPRATPIAVVKFQSVAVDAVRTLSLRGAAARNADARTAGLPAVGGIGVHHHTGDVGAIKATIALKRKTAADRSGCSDGEVVVRVDPRAGALQRFQPRLFGTFVRVSVWQEVIEAEGHGAVHIAAGANGALHILRDEEPGESGAARRKRMQVPFTSGARLRVLVHNLPRVTRHSLRVRECGALEHKKTGNGDTNDVTRIGNAGPTHVLAQMR